jgi:hypothetical protein
MSTAPGSPLAQVAGDMTILAAVVVVAILLIVGIAMYRITNTLSRIVNRAGRKPPDAECAVWLRARQAAYLRGAGSSGPPPINPATGAPYTKCEAAAAAVLDSEGHLGACPLVPSPPSPLVQDPFAYYLAGQCS